MMGKTLSNRDRLTKICRTLIDWADFNLLAEAEPPSSSLPLPLPLFLGAMTRSSDVFGGRQNGWRNGGMFVYVL